MAILAMEMCDFTRVANSDAFYWDLKKFFNNLI
jgi:hypothetical protein